MAGFKVEWHDAHFDPLTVDEAWIPEVARRGWIAMTRDRRIRWRPNERWAVRASSSRLLVLVSKLPSPELASHVAMSRAMIERFVEREGDGPWMARFNPPTPADLASKRSAKGRIERWSVG